jgi:3-methyladenine DNA glycosylase AlkD
MDKTEDKFAEIRRFCEQNANASLVKKYSRYFTEGYDAYGLDREKIEAQRDKWLESWKNELTVDDYILLGNRLISTGKYEEASLAILFLIANKDHLRANHFGKIGNWLDKGIVNWAHTDILCGHVLSHFIINKIVGIEILREWTGASSKWKRRAVPVILIDVLSTAIHFDVMASVIDPLMPDPEKFVQKGLGWFLREAWKKYPEKTESYLLKWKDTCGRIIIQYATEKMDKEYRTKFKKTKN